METAMRRSDREGTIRDVSPSLGVELVGLDVRSLAERGLLPRIKELLFRKQLLVVRDQQFEPHDLLAFTRHFGVPLRHVLTQYALPGYPDIFVISNIVENGKHLGSRYEGFGWHTDLSYFSQPAAYTILYGIEVPEEGADTLFASLYRAYDEMPEQEKVNLRPLKATYSYAKLYYQRPNPVPLTAEQLARTPDVAHPLVRVHPESGREGLYINRDDCIGIVGMSSEDGGKLISRLFDFVLEPQFQYRHKWRPRDLVVWDNRGLLHTATSYDMDRHRRLIYRTSVLGETPIAWGAGKQPGRPVDVRGHLR
jgi:taurine dioxygenase